MTITERAVTLNLQVCNGGMERRFVDIVTTFIGAHSDTAPKLIEQLLDELEAGIKEPQ